MKRFFALLLGCAVLLPLGSMTSCGYRVGGIKPAMMQGLQTFHVEMFENFSTQPLLAMQLTTALTDALQADGTYKLASPGSSDFVIRGQVLSVTPRSLSSDWRDSYLSSEIGLKITYHYEVINRKTGKTLLSITASSQTSYYNRENINMQTTRDNALSYGARLAAQSIVSRLAGT